MRGIRNTVEDILSRYEPITESGCWIWLGAIEEAGYGIAILNGSTKRVHAISYEYYIGLVPSGLELDHLCRVRCCINPDHLEAVTHLQNIRRGSKIKVTQAQVLEIRSSLLSNWLLAKQYGVSREHIRRLRNGERGGAKCA